MNQPYQTIAQVSQGGVVKLDHVPFPDGWTVNVSIAPVEDTSKRKPFAFGLHSGLISMADDFNDPLPDSYWLGVEEDESAA